MTDQQYKIERMGMQRISSVENYDLFNKICAKTKNMVRKYSSNKMSDSSDQLFDGNLFWEKQSQEKLGEYLCELSEMIDDILSLVDHLHSLNEDRVNNYFQHLKKQLRILRLQFQIVYELLSNCEEGPTLELLNLKMQQKTDRIIQAQKSSHVNIIMVNSIREYLIHSFFPSILDTAKFALDHFESQKDIFIKDLKIMGTQLLMINMIFSSAVDFEKDSLFSLDKNHPDWKALYLVCEKKSLGDAQKINDSFEAFANTIMIGHAIVQDTSKYNNQILKKLIFGVKSLYYQIFDAKKEAYAHMSNLKVQNALEVMNLIEQPAIKKLMSVGYQKIKVNTKIYIDPVVTPISIQFINNQINQGTINNITPIKINLINETLHLDPLYKAIMFKKNKQKLRIRILSNQSLEENSDSWFSRTNAIRKTSDTVFIHIHGGGFIAHSSSSHQSYTREWAKNLGIPIFSIDYSLAPKYPYPSALDDIWQAYNWILYYAYKHFEISAKTVIVGGDSAGGNLSCALTALCIKMGHRVPDGLFMAYPALDLRFNFTPSYIHALTDKIISHTILGICVASYTKNDLTQLSVDPFISPLLLSDEILSKFPPTRIMCGTNDPLHDNSWSIASKLLKLKRNVKLIIYEGISHGYLNFNTIKGMQEIQTCIDDASKQIQELINLAKIQ